MAYPIDYEEGRLWYDGVSHALVLYDDTPDIKNYLVTSDMVLQIERHKWNALISTSATDLHYHSSDRDRSNHTGTQLANTISDFSTAVNSLVSGVYLPLSGGTLSGGLSATSLSAVSIFENGTSLSAKYAPSSHGHAYSSISAIPAAIDAIDGLTPSADKFVYYTGATTASLGTITSFARTILDDSDAASARTTLGILKPGNYDATVQGGNLTPNLWGRFLTITDGSDDSRGTMTLRWSLENANFEGGWLHITLGGKISTTPILQLRQFGPYDTALFKAIRVTGGWEVWAKITTQYFRMAFSVIHNRPWSNEVWTLESSSASSAEPTAATESSIIIHRDVSQTTYADLTDGGDTSLHYHSSDRNRANHTGTQLASTISDFSTAVSALVSGAYLPLSGGTLTDNLRVNGTTSSESFRLNNDSGTTPVLDIGIGTTTGYQRSYFAPWMTSAGPDYSKEFGFDPTTGGIGYWYFEAPVDFKANIVTTTISAAGLITASAGVSTTTLSASGQVKSTKSGVNEDSAFIASSTTPAYTWYETDQGTDEKSWDIAAAGKSLVFRTLNDTGTASTTWMTVARGTGRAVTSVAVNTALSATSFATSGTISAGGVLTAASGLSATAVTATGPITASGGVSTTTILANDIITLSGSGKQIKLIDTNGSNMSQMWLTQDGADPILQMYRWTGTGSNYRGYRLRADDANGSFSIQRGTTSTTIGAETYESLFAFDTNRVGYFVDKLVVAGVLTAASGLSATAVTATGPITATGSISVARLDSSNAGYIKFGRPSGEYAGFVGFKQGTTDSNIILGSWSGGSTVDIFTNASSGGLISLGRGNETSGVTSPYATFSTSSITTYYLLSASGGVSTTTLSASDNVILSEDTPFLQLRNTAATTGARISKIDFAMVNATSASNQIDQLIRFAPMSDKGFDVGVYASTGYANNKLLKFVSWSKSGPESSYLSATSVSGDVNGIVEIGNGTVSASSTGTFGNARVGTYSSDTNYARFCHSSLSASTDGMGFVMNASGTIFVEAATGQNLSLRANNEDTLTLSASTQTIVAHKPISGTTISATTAVSAANVYSPTIHFGTTRNVNVRDLVGNSLYMAFYGANVTPGASNYSLHIKDTGGDIALNSSDQITFRYNASTRALVDSTGLSAVNLSAANIVENGTSLSAKYQPLDSDLTSIAGLSISGFAVRTGANTWNLRQLVGEEGIYITNDLGTGGNPTFGISGSCTRTVNFSNTLNTFRGQFAGTFAVDLMSCTEHSFTTNTNISAVTSATSFTFTGSSSSTLYLNGGETGVRSRFIIVNRDTGTGAASLTVSSANFVDTITSASTIPTRIYAHMNSKWRKLS